MDGAKKLELQQLPSTQAPSRLCRWADGDDTQGDVDKSAQWQGPWRCAPTHTFLFWPMKPSDHPLRESAIMEHDLLRIYELIKARLGDLWWQQSETDCWGFFICEHVGGVWLRCTVCKSFMCYKGNQCELFKRCWAGRRWRGKGFLFTVYRQNFNSKIFLMTDRDAKISGLTEKKSSWDNRFYGLIQTMDWLFRLKGVYQKIVSNKNSKNPEQMTNLREVTSGPMNKFFARLIGHTVIVWKCSWGWS